MGPSASGSWGYESEVSGTHFDRVNGQKQRLGGGLDGASLHTLPVVRKHLWIQLELETWGSVDFRRMLVGCLTETMKG